MANLTVGRSEGVAYSNNNLTYQQFKPQTKLISKETSTKFIDLMVKEINEAKSDDTIKDILFQVYATTQYDSKIRAEFDNYYVSKK